MTDADRDRIEGNLDKAKGSVKEGLGKVTDDEQTEAEGKKDKVKGGLKETLGDAKDTVSDAIDSLKKDR